MRPGKGSPISFVLPARERELLSLPLVARGQAWIAVGSRARSVRRAFGIPRGARVTTVTIVYALTLLFLQLHPRHRPSCTVVISMPSAPRALAARRARVRRAAVGARRSRATGTSPAAAVGRVRVRGARCRIATVLVLRGLPLPRRTPFDASGPGLRAHDHARSAGPCRSRSERRSRPRPARAARRCARFVRHETRPDEPIVAFPALAMIPFLTDPRATPGAQTTTTSRVARTTPRRRAWPGRHGSDPDTTPLVVGLERPARLLQPRGRPTTSCCATTCQRKLHARPPLRALRRVPSQRTCRAAWAYACAAAGCRPRSHAGAIARWCGAPR